MFDVSQRKKCKITNSQTAEIMLRQVLKLYKGHSQMALSSTNALWVVHRMFWARNAHSCSTGN